MEVKNAQGFVSFSEKELQNVVLDMAELYRWKSVHFRAARTDKGWRTPVSGGGVGFPDCLLLRMDRLVVAELKRQDGKLTVPQEWWIQAWRNIPGAEVWIWRPRDWFDGTIEKVLR